jgi:uncharacterized membrane protein YhhN
MHLTTTAGAFLIVAVLFALGDWFAVSGRTTSRTLRLEYLCKPIVPAALMAATVATPPTPECARGWFLAAFGFCLVGDVLLMLPGERLEAFGGGLGSFLLAQICFIVAFVKMGASWVATATAFAVLVALAFIPARAVVKSIGRSKQPMLIAPLLVYMAALLAMAATATSFSFDNINGSASVAACLGGLFFVTSDTVLAVNRFVAPVPRGQLAVHVTYHAAIVLLFLGGVASTVH